MVTHVNYSKVKLCIGIGLSFILVIINTTISVIHWVIRIWVQFPVMAVFLIVQWMFSRMTYGIVAVQLNLYWAQFYLHQWNNIKDEGLEMVIVEIKKYLEELKYIYK